MKPLLRTLSPLVLLLIFTGSSIAQIDWIPHIISDDYAGAHSVRFMDYQNDGDLDILTTGYDAGCHIWMYSGGQYMDYILEDDYGFAHAEPVDIDGDGDLDVIAAAQYEDQLVLFRNNFSILLPTVIDDQSDFIYHLDSGDLDGDGDLDIVTANRYANEIRWWRQNPDGWTGQTVSLDLNDPRRVNVADIDGDGHPDILASGYDSDEIVLLENQGFGDGWSDRVISSGVDKAFGVLGSDMDGDLDLDILAGSHQSGDFGWIENGTMPSVVHPIDRDFDGVRDMMRVDIDQNGTLDVLAVSYYNGVAWWSRFGDEWIRHTVDPEGHGGSCIDAGDFDGDGDLDIVSCGYTDNLLIWYEQAGSPGPVDVTLMPDPATVHVPAAGGTLLYDLQLITTTGQVLDAEYSTFVRLPSGSLFGPTLVVNATLVPFMNQTFYGLSQEVPASAPAGSYEFIGQLDYGIGTTEGIFPFVKLNSTIAARYDLDDWKGTQGTLKSSRSELKPPTPGMYALHGAYPNPFNPGTTIHLSLPDPAELKVTVYNTSGQRVAVIADDRYPSGDLSFNFDAHGLAGGVYFVRAEVPGKLEATEKIVLVK